MSIKYRYINPSAVLNQTANALAISTTQVSPFDSASIFFELRSIPAPPEPEEGAEPVDTFPQSTVLISSRVDLVGEEYQAWGDDDNYLYEKVAEKLGLTLVAQE